MYVVMFLKLVYIIHVTVKVASFSFLSIMDIPHSHIGLTMVYSLQCSIVWIYHSY